MLPPTSITVPTRMPPPALHAPLTLTIGPVTVTFTWVGDRWMHRITTAGGGMWESVEGPRPDDGDPRWPASPVLVELSRIATPRGPAILGVGLAGRSHFSASVGPAADGADRIRFEIACRCNEQPVWLGSTYRAAGGPVTVAAAAAGGTLPVTVQWNYAFSSRGLEAEPCDPPRDRSDS